MIYDGNTLGGTRLFVKNDVINFDYLGKYKQITLMPGLYTFECWGAEGTAGKNGKYEVDGFGWPLGSGGRGAYVIGHILIQIPTNFYVYVGEYVENQKQMNAARSFNGGGGYSGYNSSANYTRVEGGGGSDIRLVKGDWINSDSLNSRLIVAGGGAGGSETNYNDRNASKLTWGGFGDAGQTPPSSLGDSHVGKFGIGAGKGFEDAFYPGNGGGGYYGGPASFYRGNGSNRGGRSGGGGSSFISGYPGCNAVNINGVHTNQPIHYSKLSFTQPLMLSGIDTMPNPRSAGTMTGNQGFGFVRIVCLDIYKHYYFLTQNGITQSPSIDKNINDLTLDDFEEFGLYRAQQAANTIQSFAIAAKTNNLLINKIQKNQQIFSEMKKIPHIESIKKITIETETPENTFIKYLINNGNGWMSFQNGEWKLISKSDAINNQLIEFYGMTAAEISTITEQEWQIIYPVEEKKKEIKLTALFISNDFYESPIVSRISIYHNARPHLKQLFRDDRYRVIQTITTLKITFLQRSKKLQIILNKGGL